MKPRHILSLLAAIVMLALRPASAQINLTDTNYFQDFNNLTTDGLPDSWAVFEGGVKETALGTQVSLKPGQTNWSETTGLFGNYASTIDNDGNNFIGTESSAIQNAATNRALAVRESSNFGDSGTTGLGMGVQFANTVGLGNFKLDVDLLLLSPQGRSATWKIQYGFGSAPNSFVTVGTYVTLTTNTGAMFGATHQTIDFTNALDNQPGPVWIRFVNDTLTTGANNRPTFGIDNFNLQYSSVAVTVNPVVIVSQPVSTTNAAGSTVTFSVGESGTSPIQNQWYEIKDGATNALGDGFTVSNDGALISGSTSPTLTISGVLGAESGTYFATASNASTPATNSASATLTVLDPFITVQPQNRTNLVGDLDEFDATVAGTTPVEFTWYHGTEVVLDTVVSIPLESNSMTIFVTNSVMNAGDYTLVVSNSFGRSTSAVFTATVPVTPSTVITRWDFDDTNNYPATAPVSSIGTGVGSPVGGINYFFVNGSLADPNPNGNGAWEFQNYPPQGASNKLFGFQFNTSTAGYGNIFLAWQERHSATASSYMRVQYTTNGTDFIDGDVVRQTLVQYNYASSDLSKIPGVANNPNFAFRIVSEFESTAIGTTNANYDATTSTSAYGTGGTVRFDLMTVMGDAIGSIGIPLNIQSSGTNVVLNWSDPAFHLESATSATGPWSAPLSVTSPYTNATTGNQQYFRLVK